MKQLLILSVVFSAAVGFAAPAKKTVKAKKAAPAATTAKPAAPAPAAAPAAEPAKPETTAPVTAAPVNPAPEASTAAPASTVAVQAPTQERITGILETRPTVGFKGSDTWTTENTVGLGYQFNPNFEIGAVQYFDTNLSSPDPGRKGADLLVQDGFVRAKFNNLYKTDTFNFGYEPRLYYPIVKASRDAGQITTMRNYFKFAWKLSNAVTFTAMELPILHFYDKAGVGTKANPGFENRVYLIADFDLGKGWAFSLPVYFHQKKFRNFSPLAANSGKWDFFVYTWPEITYAISPNVTVGVAWRSDNFVTSDLGKTSFKEGVELSNFQGILSVTL